MGARRVQHGIGESDGSPSDDDKMCVAPTIMITTTTIDDDDDDDDDQNIDIPNERTSKLILQVLWLTYENPVGMQRPGFSDNTGRRERYGV